MATIGGQLGRCSRPNPRTINVLHHGHYDGQGQSHGKYPLDIQIILIHNLFVVQISLLLRAMHYRN